MTEQKHSYIFPDVLARVMAKVDMRTQYEASMLSMSLMAIGLVITIGYLVLVLDFPTWYNVVLIINGIAGIMFMVSYLTTTYQQYLTYMQALDFQNKMKGG